jgi:hypothetical protein
LIIIPIGIIFICGIGWFNAKKDYKAVMEYISSLAKVEDELDFSRKENRFYFKDDDSILSDRWIEARTDFETSKAFIDDKFKITRFKAIGIIRFVFISLVILDWLFFFIFNL